MAQVIVATSAVVYLGQPANADTRSADNVWGVANIIPLKISDVSQPSRCLQADAPRD